MDSNVISMADVKEDRERAALERLQQAVAARLTELDRKEATR